MCASPRHSSVNSGRFSGWGCLGQSVPPLSSMNDALLKLNAIISEILACFSKPGKGSPKIQLLFPAPFKSFIQWRSIAKQLVRYLARNYACHSAWLTSSHAEAWALSVWLCCLVCIAIVLLQLGQHALVLGHNTGQMPWPQLWGWRTC